MERNIHYFVSDVHLGLEIFDPAEREARFVSFLKKINNEKTAALYLLGDIWDLWFEYNDVVPKGFAKVFTAIMELTESGIKVCYIRGNHDIWSLRYFEEMGMIHLRQPHVIEIGGKRFCLAHGDGLGEGMYSYKLMKWIFRTKLFYKIICCLPPNFIFKITKAWFRNSRLARNHVYEFKNEEEPLYKWAEEFHKSCGIDYFIFGHYHTKVDLTMKCGARMFIMKDWIHQSDYLYFDGTSGMFGYSPNIE